jgi:hypothetical protein
LLWGQGCGRVSLTSLIQNSEEIGVLRVEPYTSKK